MSSNIAGRTLRSRPHWRVARSRRWITELRASGYEFDLYFFWLPTADLAIERVRAQVRAGGHSIPDDTIRRRHGRGVANFLDLYRGLADSWTVFDKSRRPSPNVIARKPRGAPDEIIDPSSWAQFTATAREA